MQSGTIKTWLIARNFGFVKPDNGGRDVFVGGAALRRAGVREIKEGDRIQFQVTLNAQGKTEAVNVSLLAAPQISDDGAEVAHVFGGKGNPLSAG